MPHQAKEPCDYRIILQQDASEPVDQQFGKTTPQGLLRDSVEQLLGFPIDAYASDANHGGGVHYDSKVAERCLSTVKDLKSGSSVQMYDGLQQLIDQGTDTLNVYCDGAHANGLDYFVRLRMNDIHDIVGYMSKMEQTVQRAPLTSQPEPYYYTSKWRRDNNDALMGDPTDDTPVSYEFWDRGAPNYALGKTRQLMCGIAEEIVNHCDLDLLELDFIRAPFFFPRQERYAQRHVMTEVVRRIADYCRQAGDRRGRPVRLSVRVPDTIQMSLSTGLDLPVWLKEGLVDMITISGGYNPMGTPWRDIVSIADKAGVPTKACLNYGPIKYNRQYFRAAATRAFDQGVTGIKLWNCFYCFDYYGFAESRLNLDFTQELSQPDKLRTMSKTYTPPRSVMPTDLVGSVYAHVTVQGQLPMTIGYCTDGIGNTIEFDIADEPADHAQEPWRLKLSLKGLAPDDQLEYAWNGKAIEPDPDAFIGLPTRDDHNREFDIAPYSCVKGVNRLEIKLLKRDARLVPHVGLVDAELKLPGVDS